MKKVMLFLLLVLFTLSTGSLKANSIEPEPDEDICEYEANMAWAETFIETGDAMQAESASMAAERTCRNRTNVREWLKNLPEIDDAF
jgi:hypothetical protein